MAAPVRLALNTRPRLVEGAHGQAGVDVGLTRARAHPVVDSPVDTVLRVLVPRAERVGVVGKGSSGDAPLAPDAVAAKSVRVVEEDRAAEFAGV